MTTKAGLYAYGLIGQGAPALDIVGIDKQHKVYPVSGRDICVMVSEIEVEAFQQQVKNSFAEFTKTAGAAHQGTQELLQAHEGVVDTLMQRTTVVPFKFGTILKDEEAAAHMLLEYEEKFKHLLAKCTGRAEWGLKVYADQQAFTHHLVQSEPRFKDLEEKREKLPRGAAYLLGRKMAEEVKEAVAAHLTTVSEDIFHTLGKDADEARLNNTLPQKLTGKKPEMVLNAVYLVAEEKVAHFCRQAEQLREEYASTGVDLEVSGPWPPYNFTL
ncbi:MAG: GvpL/GvpF family gas vesicle protein [Ktedonobacteraceae bacterium]|nr:GvpL/GvpF family gas vesicle protein [Ktedonobacteraceae bacterium]